MKLVHILGSTMVILLITAFGLYELMNSQTFQIVGEIHHRVETDEKVVALTFDDGPNEATSEILAILADKHVPATFYLIGAAIQDFPQQSQHILEAGHEIGNHSFSHKRMVLKTPQFVSMEIDATNKLIRDLGHKEQITFRPPYGKKLLWLPLFLHNHQVKTIMWDIDPLQTLKTSPTSQEIATYVIEEALPGSIILIHPWYGKTNQSRQAIPLIIDGLTKDGYTFVTVSQLLDKHIDQ